MRTVPSGLPYQAQSGFVPYYAASASHWRHPHTLRHHPVASQTGHTHHYQYYHYHSYRSTVPVPEPGNSLPAHCKLDCISSRYGQSSFVTHLQSQSLQLPRCPDLHVYFGLLFLLRLSLFPARRPQLHPLSTFASDLAVPRGQQHQHIPTPPRILFQPIPAHQESLSRGIRHPPRSSART